MTPILRAVLLDLCDEEEVVNKEEDFGWGVFRDGNDAALRVVDGLRIVVGVVAPRSSTAVVSVGFDGRGRGVGEVAVYDAVAVVHGTDKAARATVASPFRSSSAFARFPAFDAIAELVRVGRSGVGTAAVTAGEPTAIAAATA